MQLRRALLLFALVLGLAALAASLSRPARRSQRASPAPSRALPELAPSPPAQGPAQLRFSEGRKGRRLSLRAGRSAVVTVRVERAGQVALDGLGLTATAEPVTPARFDVLADEPGSYDVVFSPASGKRSVVGVLRVTTSSAR